MELLESFLAAKTGDLTNCEDAIVVSKHFAAVIDGASRPANPLWDGEPAGRLAAHLLRDAIENLLPDVNHHEAITALTATLAAFYETRGIQAMLAREPSQRLAATVAIYSKFRNQVWLVGDAQCRFGGRTYQRRMFIDDVLAGLRSFRIHLAIEKGEATDERLLNQLGREAIAPWIQLQTTFQNSNHQMLFDYGVIDGFPIPERFIECLPVPEGLAEVILASDGFPVVLDTLAESEQELQATLERDPLLIHDYLATKGRWSEATSFDDRAYLRVKITG